MKEISFLHAADLHIDSPFQGLSTAPARIFSELRESTFKVLENLVKVAIEQNVDFILLVGDLFDHEIQSLKAQIRLRQAFEKLAQHDIDVFLSHGNHDYVAGNVHKVTYPENVKVFQTEEVSYFTYEKNGEKLANIYGFSYVQRVIKDNKAKEFKVQGNHIPFHIATLHGSIKNNVEHDVYAPFQISDLQKEPFNYWALGHIHKRQILHERPYIVYPGNTQGRNRKEHGAKGCYHVTINTKETNLEFIPLQAITFEKVALNLANYDDLYEAQRNLIQKLVDKVKDTPLLIDLQMKNSDTVSINKEHELEQFLELIHEESTEQSLWQYIYNVEIEEPLEEVSAVGEHFITELIEQAKLLDVEDSIKELFEHSIGRKYVHNFTEEEKRKIKKRAKNLVLKNLLQKG